MNDDLPARIRITSESLGEDPARTIPSGVKPSSGASGIITEPALGTENYEVGREIARGGMGAILEATDGKLDRTVAVKVMHLEAERDMSGRVRFLREAQVLAMLAHPNIVPIYDIVWEDGLPLFYTMKMVKGRTLQAILNDLRKEDHATLREYTLDRLLLIFRKACDAMAFAHSRGVLHRDLKPENVMVGEFGEVLVMDWGLARLLRSNDEARMTNDEMGECGGDHSSSDIQNSSLTLQGSVMGTPQYMSPEQAMGQIAELDERSDIFSLGGILYSILTLRPPVEGRSLEEVLEKVKSGEITEPSRLTTVRRAGGKDSQPGDVLEARQIKPLPHIPGGRVPAALSAVAMKALRLEKAERYAGVTELSADIEAYQGGFATGAEQAGAWKQLRLLMLRHRAVTAALAAMVLLSVGFMLKVIASERRAVDSAEDSRRSLARAQIALAEAALRSMDSVGLAQALDSVPEDLRDDTWDYLSGQRDRSTIPSGIPGARFLKIVELPGEPGRFLLFDRGPKVQVFDAREDRVVRSIDTGVTGIKQCALSGNGEVLAVWVQGEKSVKWFEPGSGQFVRTVPVPGSLYHLALNADATLLFAATKKRGDDRTPQWQAHLIETGTGKIRWSRDQRTICPLFHPDGDRLIMGAGTDRRLRIQSVADGREIALSTNIYIRCLSVSPDGRMIAIGTYSGEVVLADSASAEILSRKDLHPGGLEDVAWTESGGLLTLGDEGRIHDGRWVLRLWRVPGFDPVDTLLGLEPGDTPAMAYSHESSLLMTSGKMLRMWRLPVDQERALVRQDSEQGWSACFLNDTTLLARNVFGLAPYDLSQSGQIRKLPSPLPTTHFNVCAIDRLSGKVVVATRNGGPAELKIFEFRNSQLEEQRSWPLPSLAEHLDFAPGAQRLAFTVPTGRAPALVMDLKTGKEMLKLPARTVAVVFAGAENRVVAAIPNKLSAGQVEFDLSSVDVATGDTLRSVRLPWRITALTVTPDRRTIAVGGSDMRIHFFDADTLEETESFRAHDDDITALSFHPTQPVIASGSLDRSVKVWRIGESGRMLHVFRGMEGSVSSLAFNPSGTLLAVDGLGAAFRVFEIHDGELWSGPE